MTGGERVVLGQLSGSAHMNITSVGLDKIAPNPSRGLMRVAYALPREANVRLSVVDVSGREVALLATGSYQAGRYQATWSGQTNRGVNAPAGIYFVRLQALGSNVTQRVVRAN
jgi:flagellar hook assembly protein FlgD